MSQQEVHIHEQLRAPIERVFAFFADHQNFVSLFGARCTVVRAGDDADEPAGVGSIRRIGSGLLSFDEKIVVFERLARIDYAIVRGGPLKNHLGTIRFKPSGDGTEIDYLIRFESRLPGTGGLFANGLQMVWKRNAHKALSALER